ncbi:hypothetical protein HYDPIDRAFT_109013, partial [Hydnomerulius pinastri MD-312]
MERILDTRMFSTSQLPFILPHSAETSASFRSFQAVSKSVRLLPTPDPPSANLRFLSKSLPARLCPN